MRYGIIMTAVAPGFDFADFELGKRKNLIRQFPEYKAVIEEFTR